MYETRLFIGGPADGMRKKVLSELDRITFREFEPLNLSITTENSIEDVIVKHTDYESVSFRDSEELIKVMAPVNWKQRGVLRALIEGYKRA